MLKLLKEWLKEKSNPVCPRCLGDGIQPSSVTASDKGEVFNQRKCELCDGTGLKKKRNK